MSLGKQIKMLRFQGLSYNAIVKKLGCAKSTVCYHLGQGQKEKNLARNRLHTDWKVDYRRKQKDLVLNHMGGAKCSKCGYDKCVDALDFHHLDGTNKLFSLSNKMGNMKIEKLLAEADKCIVLCANCHRELHSGRPERI